MPFSIRSAFSLDYSGANFDLWGYLTFPPFYGIMFLTKNILRVKLIALLNSY